MAAKSAKMPVTVVADRRHDLEVDGFTVFEGVYSAAMVERLRRA
jgi:hypothetical protein